MAGVYGWRDLVDRAVRLFPEIRPCDLMVAEGDMGALIMHVSTRHDLTFSEAAEMVAFRLPVFIETGYPQRLSA